MSSPFGQRENSGIWCRIAGGKIVRTATETTAGAVKVEKKKNGSPTGEFKWELHDDTVTGRIMGFRTRENEYNGEVTRDLVVAIDYVGMRVNVVLKEGDRYWRAFMVRLPNINLTEDVTFSPFDFISKDDGGRVIGMNVLQGGTKIPAVFTKDDPGQLPPMKRVMFKGKERPDFTEQDEWLNKNILAPANAKLSELLTIKAGSVGSAPPPPAEDDDLPF